MVCKYPEVVEGKTRQKPRLTAAFSWTVLDTAYLYLGSAMKARKTLPRVADTITDLVGWLETNNRASL